jgi:hypothetical protein
MPGRNMVGIIEQIFGQNDAFFMKEMFGHNSIILIKHVFGFSKTCIVRQICRYYRVLTMVYNSQRYWVFGFFLNNNEKTAFWKLDLFPSSGEGRHLLCWVP